MPKSNRIANRLKFDITMSDLSRLDGTMICDDDQWNAIFLILIGKVSPHVVMQADAESRARPTPKPRQETTPLTRCAANRDGECAHAQCPQLRDHEPAATGRHCPLDNHTED